MRRWSLESTTLFAKKLVQWKHFRFIQMKVFSRMLGDQNVTLFGKGNMRVDLCDIDGTVAKHFLYVADIYICFQQTGRKGMAEHVWSEVLVNCSARSILVDHSADRLIGEWSAALVDKKMIALIDFCLEFISVTCQNI